MRVLALFLTAVVAQAADASYRLQWRDLGRMTVGHSVAIELPSGVKLQGTVTAIEPDHMVLEVRKTSDKNAYPKGRATVPRPEVKHFRLTQRRGATWRVIGTTIGAAAGSMVAIPIGMYMNNEGGGNIAALVALAVGIPAGLGYLAGHASDRHVIEVAVEPD